jgi:hypothetical protein
LSDPQRLNRFAYVRNNPLRYIDPNGEDLTIVYSFDSLDDEDEEWFLMNRDEIFAQLREKFRRAGVKKVIFKERDSLTKDQRVRLGKLPIEDKRAETFVHGLVQLNFLNDKSAIVTRGNPTTTSYGFTNSGRAEVFLSNIASGSCGRVCAIANVAGHEIGHALGLEGRGHNVVGLSPFEFGRVNIMRRPPDIMYSGSPNSQRLYFNTDVEKNIRVLKEVDNIKPIY